MNLTEHRIDEIFADIKRNSKSEQTSVNKQNDTELNKDEFKKSLLYL